MTRLRDGDDSRKHATDVLNQLGLAAAVNEIQCWSPVGRPVLGDCTASAIGCKKFISARVERKACHMIHIVVSRRITKLEDGDPFRKSGQGLVIRRYFEIRIELTTTAEDSMHMVTGHTRLHDWIEATEPRNPLAGETPECLCDTEAINRQSRRHD